MKRQDVVPRRIIPLSRSWLHPLCLILLLVWTLPADGAVIQSWLQRTKNPAIENGAGHAVTFDRQGNVIITGVFIDLSLSQRSGSNYYTAKYSGTTGAVLWEKSYSGFEGTPGGGPDDHPVDVATDSGDNVIVTGSSPRGFNNYDFYTVKYAGTNGTQLWERRYNGAGNGNDMARALALDAAGNVFVSGFLTSTNGNADFYTAKYAANDGSVLWEKQFNGPGNSRDEVYAMAMDSFGNVAVTGISVGLQGIYDYYTIKYSGDDGTPLWEKRYNGPGNGYDQPNAIAVDTEGNVVVTGISQTTASILQMDIYTVKYAANDGALLWEKRYNGPANYNDSGSALAVDGAGNVLMTGVSLRNPNNPDYYTAKYAKADGALLWEVRYRGPTNSTDAFDNHAALALVLDASGNAIVTGNSWGGTTRADYYTAKYSSTNGSLIWEARYNGPVNGLDSPVGLQSLAIGPSGQVAITGSSVYNLAANYYGWATILYREDLPPIMLTLDDTNSRLQWKGVPGATYYIERSAQVGGPWEFIGSSVAPASGMVNYVDTNRLHGVSFYRTRGL